jgi:hypothetical protein
VACWLETREMVDNVFSPFLRYINALTSKMSVVLPTRITLAGLRVLALSFWVPRSCKSV